MPGAACPVAILYRHCLLGEGIARAVAELTGTAAVVASADDPASVRAVVVSNPAVLVFERTAVLDAFDLPVLLPDAHLVDVTHAVAAGPTAPQCQTGLVALAAMVAGSAGHHGVHQPST